MKFRKITIKRPLAMAGACSAAVTALAFYWRPAAAFAVALIMSAFFLIFRKKIWRSENLKIPLSLMLAVTVLSASVSSLGAVRRETVLNGLNKENPLCLVRVSEISDRGSGRRVTGSILEADGKPVNGAGAVFYVYGIYPEPGDEILCRLTFYPGHYESAGEIRFNASSAEIVGTRGSADGLAAFIYRVKAKARDILKTVMPPREASLAEAMITGERSDMPAELSGSLQRAGVSHIVVVSGMHITILLGILSFLLRTLRQAPVRAVITGMTILALMCFYGFTPSVIRACVMGGLVFFGGLFYYGSDGSTSLSAAAIVILLFSPESIRDVSFQLSFACCFAIVSAYPAVIRRVFKKRTAGQKNTGKIARTASGLVKAFLLSLTINIVTLPVLILNGMSVSLVSPLTNPLVTPLVPAAMAVSLISVLLGVFSPALSAAAGYAAMWSIRVIIYISEFAASFTYAAADVSAAYMKIWAVYAAAVTAGYFIFKGKGRLWPLALAVFLPLAAVTAADRIARNGAAEIMFFRGESLILRGKGDTAVIAERMTEDGAVNLRTHLLNVGIDYPDKIILLEYSGITEEETGAVFRDSEIEKIGDGGAKNTFSVGDMRINIEESCVIIDCGDTRLTAAYRGWGAVSDSDYALIWRSAKRFEGEFGGFAAVYEDIAPRGNFDGLRYGYWDVVQLLIKDGGVSVSLR